MRSSILTISGNRSMNYLLDTVLSRSYKVVPVGDIYQGMIELKRVRIDLIIIDVDYHTQENWDFIQHVQTSGLYQDLPIYILTSDKESSLQNSKSGGPALTLIHKPFSPLDILRKAEELFAKTLI
ncbi:MAG: hypothetical protein ABWZ25_03750 [Chitinophagaceae bacterium]